MKRTLNDLFAEAEDKYPDHDALSFFGEKTKYWSLRLQVRYFSDFLRSRGLKPGDRVVLLLPNCPQMVIAYRGILKAGCVMAALNPMLKPEELVSLVKQVRPKMFVALNSYKLYWHNLAIRAALPEDCQIVLADLPDYMPKPLGRKFKILNTILLCAKKLWSLISGKGIFRPDLSWLEAFREGDRHHLPYTFENLPDPGDLAVLQFTGGTTGVPKAAMLTHANLVANAEQAIDMVGKVIDENSKVLSVIPCFHVYGLSVCLNIALWRGSEVILMPKFNAKEAMEIIEKQKVTMFPALPKVFAAMVDHPDFPYADLTSLKLCVSGSGALDQEVKKHFERVAGKCEIIEGYGLSETSPIASINPPGQARPGSLGKLVKGTEMRIVDGELWLRGPQVMKGYWENEEETKLVMTPDGWLKTGDMVEERDGYLWLTDRKKDMIKISGENVYPSEIEEVLKRKFNLSEVYVVGVPSSKGESIVAFMVIPLGSKDLSIEQVKDACKGLGKLKVPSEAIFLRPEQVPRTYLGKVQKKDLRALLRKSST